MQLLHRYTCSNSLLKKLSIKLKRKHLMLLTFQKDTKLHFFSRKEHLKEYCLSFGRSFDFIPINTLGNQKTFWLAFLFVSICTTK